MFSKCLLNIYVYAHELLLLSAWSVEMSFCGGQWLMQRLSTGQVLGKNYHLLLTSKPGYLYHPLPHRPGNIVEEEWKGYDL